MPFLIGLLTRVLSNCMSPLDSLFLPLAAAQPVLMGLRLGNGNYCTLRLIFNQFCPFTSL